MAEIRIVEARVGDNTVPTPLCFKLVSNQDSVLGYDFEFVKRLSSGELWGGKLYNATPRTNEGPMEQKA